MTTIRPVVKRSKWAISKHEFLSAYHYALQYPEWAYKYRSLMGLSSVTSDGMPHGTSVSNPTEAKGMQAATIAQQMRVIEETVMETDATLYEWILEEVTHENVSYNTLYMRENRIPCSKGTFYDRRRKFYYLLSKKIGIINNQNIGTQGTK